MKLGMLVAIASVTALLGSGVAHADRPPGAPRGPLRAALLQRFDKNGDGRLGPRERLRAARALHRLANKLARGGRMGPRARLIQRLDTNGDGNVGPEEMPPGLADRLRKRDRNRDGWLEQDELP